MRLSKKSNNFEIYSFKLCMKKIILIMLCVFTWMSVQAQLEMGKWRMHISPYIGKAVVYAEGTAYCILENGIVEYDEAEEEHTVLTYANYLSDVSPTAIAYDSETKYVVVGYDNGNVDLLKKSTIHNIPAIKQATVNGVKNINKIVIKDKMAYLLTGVGIVVLDLKKKEVRDTYYVDYGNVETQDLAFANDSIYAITKESVYVGSYSSLYLSDPSQWHKMSNIPDYSSQGGYNNIEVFNNELFLSFRANELSNGDTLYKINGSNVEVWLQDLEFYDLNGESDEFLISTYGNLFIYDKDLNLKEDIYMYSHGYTVHPVSACKADGKYYIADRFRGLNRSLWGYESIRISFSGPRFNDAYRAKWTEGKLSFASGGILSGAPTFNKKGGSTMEDGKWLSTVITEDPLTESTNAWDFICTAINPENTDEVAYGTYSSIPLVITNKGAVTDTFVFANSLIEEMGSVGWGFISDLVYDKDGNLWMANTNASRPIKVRTKNGEWFEFFVGSQANGKRLNRLIIDHNGVKWLGVKGVGIVAFDDGGTIGDDSDDRHRVFTTSVNGGDLPSAEVEAIAVDFDNNIWIGTEEGMRVLYNTENVFDASPGQYNFQKLLIEYGENVEIVLGNTHITSIQIDGANRKWIGTSSSGVFLLSPDGLEIERNFTMDNSPLLSNTILDIAIDHATGEVFFVTEKGLVSYRSDATQGDDTFSDVKIFPNPVHPDFDGMITMQGVAYNSDVKITDVSGRLVYQTHSRGGTATWDGRTITGEKVKTGVYLIWNSIDSDEFKGRKVGKVMIIN